jgi:hypothetical protein
MIYIDKELIDKELKRDRDNNYVFIHKKLSNKFLDWLFRHYYCVEMCENSYDSEPLDYDEWEELQKTSEGRAKLAQVYRDYEPERMRFCNWQEPTMRGNWGMTQEHVDKCAKESLKEVKNIPTIKKERIYYAKKDDQIRIFIYGRDVQQQDTWFIFNKRDK